MKNKMLRVTVCFLFLMRITPVLCAQDGGIDGVSADGPEVIVKTAPETPAARSVWTLTLLADHPLPEEVAVLAPPFTETFLLERFTKGPVTVEMLPWTRAEYRFILNDSGTFVLQPFTVITPRGRTVTPALTVNVQRARAGQEVSRVKLVWEGGKNTLTVGENAVFSLKAGSRNFSQPLPPAKLFAPHVPKGVILETEEPPQEEKAAGLVMLLMLVPLEKGALVLPARNVSSGGAVFEIPALRVTVNDAAVLSERDNAENAAAVTASGKKDVPFPLLDGQTHSRLLRRYREDCETVYSTAKNLWERGYRAEALAQLRRSERDHPAGRVFSAVRQEAELSLGLAQTKGENPKNHTPFITAAAVCIALAVSARLIYPRLRIKRRFFAFAPLLFAVAGLGCLYPPASALLESRTFAAGSETAKRVRAGVSRETAVRRVPDHSGETLFIFSEGQPVRLYAQGGRAGNVWYWAVAHNETETAGWIPADKIVFY